MIIKLQLNDGYTDAWNQLSGANVWMNTFNEVAEENVYYSPMPYGAQPNKNAGGTSASALTENMNIIYSDCANPIKNLRVYLVLSGEAAFKTTQQPFLPHTAIITNQPNIITSR